MKLRNKKTGEIVEFEDITRVYKFIGNQNTYNSLAELNKEWEDVPEEPKRYWFIENDGEINSIRVDDDLAETLSASKDIGNYFETEEEAEKAVEKLKAWKRLKDSGISFEAKVIDGRWYIGPKVEPKQRTFDEVDDLFKDVMFIFGGKE